MKDIMNAVKLNHSILKNNLENTMVNKDLFVYHNPKYENMILWNTAYYFDSKCNLEKNILDEIKNLYNKKNSNGYIISYSKIYDGINKNKKFVILKREAHFEIDLRSKKNSVTIKRQSNLTLFCDNIDAIFNIGEQAKNKLCKLLISLDSTFNHNSYHVLYNNELCGIFTTVSNINDVYIYNLGIFNQFQNLGISSEIVRFISLNNKDKNIHIQTEINNNLHKYNLPKYGYRELGFVEYLSIKDFINDKKNYN